MGVADNIDRKKKTSSNKPSKAYGSSTVGEFGTEQMWQKAQPAASAAAALAMQNNRLPDFGPDNPNNAWFSEVLNTLRDGGIGAPKPPAGSGPSRRGGAGGMNPALMNAAQILMQQRASNPYQQLEAALQQTANSQQQTGNDAIAQLKAALSQAQNPYAGMQFQAPQVGENPLAAFMQQSGADDSQVQAMRSMLGQWSQAATTADQDMAKRLSASWQNDQTARQSDADFAGAAFQQSLANNLAQQKAALAAQQQQRQDQITQQLIDLAMKNGVPLSKLGVTL